MSKLPTRRENVSELERLFNPQAQRRASHSCSRGDRSKRAAAITDANEIIDRCKAIVAQWPQLLREIERSDFCRRMFAKLRNPHFLLDMRPLLAAQEAQRMTEEAAKKAFSKVFFGYVVLLPGEAWAESDKMKERFGISCIA